MDEQTAAVGEKSRTAGPTRTLVTGVTGDIGGAVCVRLLGRGHALALGGRDRAHLTSLSTPLQHDENLAARCDARVGNLALAASTHALGERLGVDNGVVDGCVLTYPRVEGLAQPFAEEVT